MASLKNELSIHTVPMKVLFILTYYTPHWTGLTEHARRLAEGLASKGHTAVVVTTQHERSLPLTDSQQGVKIIRAPVWFRLSRTLLSPLFFVRVWQQLEHTQQVVVYTPLAEIVLISILAKLRGKRLILVHNGDLLLPQGIGNRILEKIFDVSSFISGMLADTLVAYSDDYAVHSRFLRHFRTKTTAILPLFPQSNIAKKSVLTLSKRIPARRRPVIGFAGRFVEEKGFDILLQAIPIVVQHYPKAIFVFAGETKMVYEQFFEKNQKLVDAVSEYFFSLGRLSQEEMRGFYPLLDVFVLPSRSDCLAFVQVEAMLAGIPVVATNIAGARVPVRETGMGKLVQPEAPDDLARGIIEVLKKKGAYEKKMGLVKALFDYEKTLAQYEALLTVRH